MRLCKIGKIIDNIVSNPRWKVAIIWGLAIGCFDIFVYEVIHIFFVGLIIIAFFSYFYLSSLILGALCGATSAIPYFFRTLYLCQQAKISCLFAIPAIIPLIFILAAPGILGGYLAEKYKS